MIRNLLFDLPTELNEEQVTVLAQDEYVRIERIVSLGHRSPDGIWYDQEEDEWVSLLQGEAILLFEDGEEIAMKAGDHLDIPAHRKHRVHWTPPNSYTVWLVVFRNRSL